MKLKLILTDEQKIAVRLEKLCKAKMQTAPVQAAKYLHVSVRNSLRKSPYPSKPGTPPHVRNKLTLKNAIASKVENTSTGAQVLVGLASSMGSRKELVNIAGLHEVGGAIPYDIPKFQVGQFGPIAPRKVKRPRKKRTGLSFLSDNFVMIRLKTEAQVQRARNLSNSIFSKNTATYPPRPFLKPALEKAMKSPRFLSFFSLK